MTRERHVGTREATAPMGTLSEPEALAARRAGRPLRSRCERLTGKERLVLAELARGNSTDEIGIALNVSPHTVRTHVKNLMRRRASRTRAHALAISLSERVIDMRR